MDEQNRAFSSTVALRIGWQRTRENLRPFLILGVLSLGLELLRQRVRDSGGNPSDPQALLVLALQVLQIAMTMLLVHFALRAHDGKPLLLERSAFTLYELLSFVLVSVLYGLIVSVGLLLLVVPGVLWSLTYLFAAFLVVDRSLSPLAALRESGRLTHGVKGQLFGHALLMLVVNGFGALSFGLGLLITLPTTFVATAHVLRRLQAHHRTAAPRDSCTRLEPPGELVTP